MSIEEIPFTEISDEPFWPIDVASEGRIGPVGKDVSADPQLQNLQDRILASAFFDIYAGGLTMLQRFSDMDLLTVQELRASSRISQEEREDRRDNAPYQDLIYLAAHAASKAWLERRTREKSISESLQSRIAILRAEFIQMFCGPPDKGDYEAIALAFLGDLRKKAEAGSRPEEKSGS